MDPLRGKRAAYTEPSCFKGRKSQLSGVKEMGSRPVKGWIKKSKRGCKTKAAQAVATVFVRGGGREACSVKG